MSLKQALREQAAVASWTRHDGRVGARLHGRRWRLGVGGFLILVLVCGLGGVADARGSLGVVGTPTHPQMLACFEEATQFTGILPPAGPHDIGFGAGYFPQARRLADMDPPNSGRDAQLTGYKLPPVVNPGATVTMTIAPGARPTWCNRALGRHAKGACRSRTGPVCTSPVSFPRASGSPMVEYEAAFRSTCGSAGNEGRATSFCRFSLDGAEPRPEPAGVRRPRYALSASAVFPYSGTEGRPCL